MKPPGPQQQMTKHDNRMCVPYVEYLRRIDSTPPNRDEKLDVGGTMIGG